MTTSLMTLQNMDGGGSGEMAMLSIFVKKIGLFIYFPHLLLRLKVLNNILFILI